MSMKTVMKKRRRKTEEDKKEKLINMSKMKKLMKIIERADFEYNIAMMNIRTTPMSMKTVMKKRRRKTEEEKKEKLINMSKMNKCMKTRARCDFEYYRNDDEH